MCIVPKHAPLSHSCSRQTLAERCMNSPLVKDADFKDNLQIDQQCAAGSRELEFVRRIFEK